MDLGRRADLQDAAAVHDGDPVRHRQRLLLVVRDEKERDAGLALDALQLDLHAAPQLDVECRQRLVEQQQAGLRRQGAGQGDALLLAARQLIRTAAGQVLEPDELENGLDAGLDRASAQAEPVQPEADVPARRSCAGTGRRTGRRC